MRPALLIPLLALAYLGACTSGDSSPDNGIPSPTRVPLIGGPTQADLPVTVAVTLPLFADFVREVGGENVEVFSLLPPGADPHTYRLTPAELKRIAEADFFFVNGLGLDTALRELIEENRKEDAKVIPFAPNVRSPRGGELGDRSITAEEAGDNPHLWLDPMLARVYAEIIADTFIIYDSINEELYSGNFSAYADDIRQLNEEIAGQMRSIPEGNRKLITFHDSFTHFARRYGLTMEGFAVLDPGQDPSSDDISNLIQSVRDGGVPAVFAEHGFDASVLEEVAGAAGVQVCTLYSDILNAAVQTYLDLVRSNAEELFRCLGGGVSGD